MAGFLAPLDVEEIEGDDRRWRLLNACIYHLKSADGAEFVDVPAGFITDFGSIPQMLWNVPGLSPTGHYRKAYVVHDKLFVAPVICTPTSARVCSFTEANAILREAMGVLDAALGGNAVTRAGRAMIRATVWLGVSTGGRVSWNRYRHADAAADSHEVTS